MAGKTSDSVVRKFFLNLLKGHRKSITIMIAVSVCGSIMTAFVPYIYGRLFDMAIVPNTSLTFLFSLIGVWSVLILISNYTKVRTGTLGDILGIRIALEMQSRSYGHFLKLPISFHKNKKTGSMLQKVSNGSWHLRGFINVISNLLPSLMFMIFATVAMVLIRWELGAIVAFTFVIYTLVTLKLAKPAVKSENKHNKVLERESGKVHDKLYNIFLIKNYNMEDSQRRQIFKSLVLKTFPSLKESTEKFARLNYFQGIVYNMGFIATLATAVFFLRSGQISEGEFIMFFGYISMSFSPFFILSNFYRDYKKLLVAIKRIIRLEKMVPEEMKHGNRTIENFKGRITIEDLSFGYTKKKENLKDINLKIKAGESVALVGESGMGKTTLSELILGYYKPSKGKIFLDDVNISRLKLPWLRSQIAVVPQEMGIFNDTLLKNIRHANPKASMGDVINAAKAANAHDFIMALPRNYRTVVGEKGVKLSMGQKQRIAITMAFLKNPKILILDEPTASLDAKSEKNVQEGIQQLIKGRTTIIIAHRFSTVKNVDRIIVIDKASVAESGTHEELMKMKGKYNELYRLQSGFD